MNKDELVQLLKSDVAGFNEYRTKNPNQERWDWQGIDLSKANLKGADLRRIDFSGANFQGTDLSEAQFGNSVLQGATFHDATLKETIFHHCQMQGADLRSAQFTPRTRLGRVCVNLHSFEGVRWDRAHLEEILEVINQNQDWQIRYEIVPKDGSRPQAGQAMRRRSSPA